MKQKKITRVFSAMITVIMLLSLLPTSAFAAETNFANSQLSLVTDKQSTLAQGVTQNIYTVYDKNGKQVSGLSYGNGSVDAAFRALENICGRHFELDDFELGAVTEGKDSIGQALVRLRANGKVFSGRGVSTDIVGASIKAYLSALNKIVYEENN